jgi:deferrochelatase/peroxidase EfeB
MVAGRTALPLSENGTDPPADTGEALGLPAANLTITFGFGRTLFELAGSDRFGLAPRLPPALAPIPAFRGDQLDAGISDGDVFIQICADDAQVTFHALRNLIRISLGAAAVQWEQVGFGRVATTSRRQATPRNLHGFKDGTNNIKLEDAAALRDHVWVPAGVGPAWMAGGSYAVIRRIRMLIERWDNSKLADQERTIGRRKQDGAPLGQAHEHDPVLLGARRRDGALVIPARAHIRHAAPASNQGARLLRRGYSFVNGIDERTRQLDAGLFFIAYQRDPRTQFVPIQRRLSEHDELAEYVRHIGSGVYACPPGIRPGGYVGETLLG